AEGVVHPISLDVRPQAAREAYKELVPGPRQRDALAVTENPLVADQFPLALEVVEADSVVVASAAPWQRGRRKRQRRQREDQQDGSVHGNKLLPRLSRWRRGCPDCRRRPAFWSLIRVIRAAKSSLEGTDHVTARLDPAVARAPAPSPHTVQ